MSLRFLACRRLSSGHCTTLVVSATAVLADLGYMALTRVLIQFHAAQDMGDDFVEDTDEGLGWSSDQVSRFFDAFQEHGQDWAQVCTHESIQVFATVKCQYHLSSKLALQVSQLVGKTAQQSEALYQQHSLYLNLASQLIQKEAFMGMVKGYQEHNSQACTAAAVVSLLEQFLYTFYKTVHYTSVSSLPIPLACMLAESAAGC